MQKFLKCVGQAPNHKKTKEQNGNRLTDTEETGGCQRGGRMSEIGERDKEAQNPNYYTN